jgi:hypothetical protein
MGFGGGGGSSSISASTDVALSNPANGQVLTYNSSLGKWQNAASVAGFSDPTTAKGDLIVHGTTTARLPVGSDGQVLTADSTQSVGLNWTAVIASSKIDAANGIAGLDGASKLKISEFPDSVQAIIIETGGVYALRSTVTASATRPVIWRGADSPTIGSGYAINDMDTWEPTV